MPLDAATLDAIRAAAAAAKPARKELQRLAKLCGIKANGKSTVILEELEKLAAAAAPAPVAAAAAPPPAPVAPTVAAAAPAPVAPAVAIRPAPALPRRSIAPPPAAPLPPLPPPIASVDFAPPPRQPAISAEAIEATLGKIDAAVQEVNRASDHRAATVADRGALNVPRPKQLRPHGAKKAHVLSPPPPPRTFMSLASPVCAPAPLGRSNLSPVEPWRLAPKSAMKQNTEDAREVRRDAAFASSKAARGAAADQRRGL
jgi:hypothetical protein